MFHSRRLPFFPSLQALPAVPAVILSKSLVDKFGIICFEDLNIKNIVKDPIYAKGIMDAAWNKLVTYTIYKAENAGRRVILVNPFNTSQMCSKCGTIIELVA